MNELTDLLRQHQLFEYSWGVEETCTCGVDKGDFAAHVAAVLAEAFVLVPKDQLHQETARIAGVIKTEMHRKVPKHMRLPGIPEWIERAAAAVLASLGLHQGAVVVCTDPRHRHRDSNGTCVDCQLRAGRLVGSWRPADD